MTGTYLVEKLRERRRTIEASRRRSRSIIGEVADLLSPDEKILRNRGIIFRVTEDELAADLDDILNNRICIVRLIVDEEGGIWLGDEAIDSQSESDSIYRRFSDFLTENIPVDQLMK